MSYRLTNKALQGWFKQANRWYFKNRLPKSTILKFKSLPGKFGVAYTNFIQRKPTKQELKRGHHDAAARNGSLCSLETQRPRQTF